MTHKFNWLMTQNSVLFVLIFAAGTSMIWTAPYQMEVPSRLLLNNSDVHVMCF